jgi:hypothetical protein
MDRPGTSPSSNPLFDFVTREDFRASLESDYGELRSSFENRNWKAAHVLAGSIIEAILVDSLLADPQPGDSEAAMLKLELAPAIDTCARRGILTQRTVHLSEVIRDYRNLIHPGRTIRLKDAPTEEGAQAAMALLTMVAKEVSKKRAEVYGLTAQQVATKIEQDPATVMTVAPFMFRQLKGAELERLLLTVLPEQNYRLLTKAPSDLAAVVRPAISQCFRYMFDQAPYPLRQQVTRRYVEILQNESGDYREAYEASFFRALDLEYLEGEERDLVGKHIWALIESPGTDALKTAEGIGKFIPLDRIADRTEVLVRKWLSVAEPYRPEVHSWLSDEYCRMPDDGAKAMEAEIKRRTAFWPELDALHHLGIPF